jgi:hypothetical protein
MFDAVIEVEVTDDAVSCADALAASIVGERRVIADRFLQVAAWADLHCPEAEPQSSVDGSGPMTAERRRRLAEFGETCVAAEGTPRVTRSAVVELGCLLGTSTGSAKALLRDVLELRHRLPRTWAAVQELKVDAWKARHVAAATHALSQEAARQVDAEVLDALIGLPWGRAKDVVEGKVIAADRLAHAAKLAAEENRTFVSTRRRSTVSGLRTLIARGDAGDIARLEAMIAHLAGLLETPDTCGTTAEVQIDGDPNSLDNRRARALGMLANPALTCLFLARHHPPAGAPAGTAGKPDPDEAGGASAVELAVAFGQLLDRLGPTAWDRLRPRSVLHLHVAAEALPGAAPSPGQSGCGVVRVEDPVAGGPISLDQARTWLRHYRVTLTPVVDPTGCEPVDGYEIPATMRRALRLLHPYETFPYGTLPTAQADLDHTKPYRPPDNGGPPVNGGPPGQTALDNLGPLGRTHHLAKTFGGFTVHQPVRGVYLWRTPTGHRYRVDHTGTHPLGRHPDPSPASPAASPALSTAEQHFRDLLTRHTAA